MPKQTMPLNTSCSTNAIMNIMIKAITNILRPRRMILLNEVESWCCRVDLKNPHKPKSSIVTPNNITDKNISLTDTVSTFSSGEGGNLKSEWIICIKPKCIQFIIKTQQLPLSQSTREISRISVLSYFFLFLSFFGFLTSFL